MNSGHDSQPYAATRIYAATCTGPTSTSKSDVTTGSILAERSVLQLRTDPLTRVVKRVNSSFGFVGDLVVVALQGNPDCARPDHGNGRKDCGPNADLIGN